MTGPHSAVAAGLATSLRHVLAVVALGLSAHPACGAGIFTPLDAADSARLGHHAASQALSAGAPSVDGRSPANGWLVRVDRPLLFRTIHRAARQGSGRILLNVAEGLEFDVAVERAGPTLSGYSLSGSVVGVAGGAVTLMVNAEVLMGTVWTPRAAYEIAPLTDGVHVFRKVEPSARPRLSEPVRAEGGWGQLPPVEQADAEGDDVVDVLVLWTPTAMENAGGEAQLRAGIDLAVAWANDAYERSGVAVRLNLVGAEQVDYVEHCEEYGVGECRMIIDLGRLRDPSDGFMDEVHGRRDALGADLVSLFVGAGDFSGIANLAGAFSVVTMGESGSTWYLTIFAHELGHNMGLAHDRYVGGSGVLPFSSGYVNKLAFAPDAPPDTCWWTIMAYSTRCRDHGFEFAGGVVPYFSTPDRHHPEDEDAPLGVPKESDDEGADGPADAVRSLNLVWPTVANLRSGRTDDGDAAETATPVATTSTTFAALTDGDIDYFRIELPEAGKLRAEITDGFNGHSNYGLFRISAALVAEGGELIVEDHGTSILIEAELAAGVYFIRVGGGYDRCFGAARCEYTLVVSFSSAADDHGDGEPEATAAELPSNIAGELREPADADYFRFTVAERGVIRLETAGDTDVIGTLTSEDGILSLTDDDSGVATNFLLVAKLDPGVYFLRVTGFLGATGRYSLDMSFTPLSEASDDHADSPEAATGLEAGAGGELEAALDRDYFRIEVAGDSHGQLWVESTGDTDVDGALLSGDGALLDEAEHGGDWPNFVVGAHVEPGSYFLRVAGNSTTTGRYGLAATFIADNRTLPLFISASHSVRQGFARIINRSNRSGDVAIHAIDDAGRRSGPITLLLDAGQAAHFNSDDLEHGNEAKRLSGGVGAGEGDWQLELATDLDIEALAYVRTNDGFLTSMHELSSLHDPSAGATVPTFNPASNLSQVSKLRLVSRGPGQVSSAIIGVDDGGSSSRSGGFRRRVFLDVAPGASLTVSAQELENGSHAVGRYYVLGDGDGKWRLNRWQPRRQPVGMMSLLESPTGHLTNLSRRTPIVGTDVSLPLFVAANNPARQGFARIINYSRGGDVTIHAIDDAGQRRGPVTLSLAGGHTAHFNSEDLEDGNPAKGLSRGVGDGEGDWRLELAAESHMHIEALAYVRTADGFLTGMNALVPLSDGVREVVFFNPGSNNRQVSRLRLVNPADADAAVTINGVDDAGNAAPAGDVTLTVPAGAAAEITAQQLEAGADHFDGRFGDGQGKWRLFIEADQDIQAMSLLESPTGHIANLSSGTAVR